MQRESDKAEEKSASNGCNTKSTKIVPHGSVKRNRWILVLWDMWLRNPAIKKIPIFLQFGPFVSAQSRQIHRVTFSKWKVIQERHFPLFLLLVWWIQTAIHPARQRFHYFTSSLIPSLSVRMDGKHPDKLPHTFLLQLDWSSGSQKANARWEKRKKLGGREMKREEGRKMQWLSERKAALHTEENDILSADRQAQHHAVFSHTKMCFFQRTLLLSKW